MNYLAPPTYDAFNIDLRKFKISAYLKALGLHVYLATTKKSYFDNDMYIESNAQAIKTLKHTLNKEFLSIVPQFDSAFVVWNMLSSLKDQASNNVEREPIVD